MWHDPHISEENLLQAVDGELSSRRYRRVRRHLEGCAGCRARQAKLERSMAEFAGVYRDSRNEGLPGIATSRALLRARLNELAREPVVPAPFGRRFLNGARGPAFAGLAAVVLIGFLLYFSATRVDAASRPDARLTPGVTRPVTRDEICSRLPEGFYPIPASLAHDVFEKYSIRDPRPRTYEVDYLITPALGGAGDVRNLWPQPYSAGEWNAHVKDALEIHLYRLVCDGKLDLATAQQDISNNWIAAYRKYFNTARPLEQHQDFSIDPPWER